MKRVLPITLAAATVAWNIRGFSEEKSTANSASLGERIEELKRGQERILEELAAIRNALQERPTRVEQPARPALPAAINVHGEPFKGATNATVGIIAYSDFDCSHCAQFATQVFPELDQKYIATGKVKYFFRDLPERGNAESMLKARLARCAGEQGKFWQMHDYLFAAHPALTNEVTLFHEAETAGLETNRIAACLAQDKYTIMIQRSGGGALRMGIQGTPAFIIGKMTDEGDTLRVEKMLLGFQDLETLGREIEGLSGAKGN